MNQERIDKVIKAKSNIRKYAITTSHPAYQEYLQEFYRLTNEEMDELNRLDPEPLPRLGV